MTPNTSKTAWALGLTLTGFLGFLAGSYQLLRVLGSAGLSLFAVVLQALNRPPEDREAIPFPDFPLWASVLCFAGLLALIVGLSWLIRLHLQERRARELEGNSGRW